MEIYSTSSDSVLKLSRQSATSTLFKLGTDSALILNNNNSDVLTIKNGNVGVGTTAPSTKLYVAGEGTNGDIFATVSGVNPELYLKVKDANGYYPAIKFLTETGVLIGDVFGYKGSSMMMDAGPGLSLRFRTDNGAKEVFYATAGGNVGIGTTAPGYKLEVNGNAAGTSWTNLSDQRFKKNVTSIDSALGIVGKLRGVTFDWRVGEFGNRDFPTGKQVGFVAQEVEKVLPEIVTTDNEGYKGVEYANLTAVLVEAVKELKAENEIRQKENAKLKAFICLDHPRETICAE